ncbi:MAG: phage tail family protein [Bryobacterales bacterium]|nr:phage tail family protein [Bryobacterales bacterium]
MAYLVRFGSTGSKIYTFPTVQKAFNTNFANLVPQTTRMPGVSGGFDNFGGYPAPQEIGNIQATFTLRSTTREGMEALRDSLNAITEWGEQWLYMQPSDPNLSERKCRARINNIAMPQDNEKAGLWQPVTINFQASDPHWYAVGTEAPLWGDVTTAWGTSKWGGNAVIQAMTGGGADFTTFTVTNSGKMIAIPRFTWVYKSGTAATSFEIQRRVGGVTEDVVAHTILAGVGSGKTLEINCRALSVKLYTSGVPADAYSSLFSYFHPAWFRLEPGANQLYAYCNNGVYDLYIRWQEVYI